MKQFVSYLYLFLFAGLILLTGGFFYTMSNYIDPFNSCHIHIDEEILKGNKKTIFKALNLLKKQDPSSYQDVCGYVDTISENLCPIDHAYGGEWRFNNQPGCYLKASKEIFITPNKEDSEQIVASRAAAIAKYAKFSKEYWER